MKQRIEDAAIEWERRKKTNYILGKSYLLSGKFLEEAKNFHKQNSRSIFLSDLAIEFILESIEQKRDTQIKNIGCGFILPISFIFLIFSTMVTTVTSYTYFYDDAYVYKRKSSPIFHSLFPVKDFARFIKLSISLKRIPGNDFDFRNGNFRNTDFSYTDLKDADFRYTKLKDANFRYTILRNSDLSGAELRNADLRNTDLANADLKNADLSGADLRNADLSGVDLRNVKINAETKLDAKWYLVWEIVNQGAFQRNLSGANLTYANLKNADLRNADLRNAELSGADFKGADLSGTNFTDSDLNCYQLKEIMEIGNILSEGRCTNLKGAKNITIEQVQSAKNWNKAKYDKDFRAKLGLPPEKEE